MASGPKSRRQGVTSCGPHKGNSDDNDLEHRVGPQDAHKGGNDKGEDAVAQHADALKERAVGATA